jgi:hypothetical protein
MKTSLVVLVLLAVLASGGSAAVCHGLSEADATSAVAQADQRVSVCYSAVAGAQKAGANVSGLLVTLNDAGVLLSEAHLALVNGSFDSASALAGQCVTKLDGFDNAANSLRDSASQARFVDFWVSVVGSVVGAVAVVVGGFVVWLLLNRRVKKRQSASPGGV